MTNFFRLIRSLTSLVRLTPTNLLKKRLWYRCFLVNFVKFLRTPFLQNTSERLLPSFWNNCLTLQYQFSLLSWQSLKKTMWTKFGGNNEIALNLQMTWPLITCSGDKLTFTIATITKLGRNTYQNETVSFLNVTWTNCVIMWHMKTS